MAINPQSLHLTPDHPLARVRQTGLMVGIAGVVVSLIGVALDPKQFFQSYLIAYVFWTGCALGCLSVSMIHHVTGGAWGTAIRRFLESGAQTLPLLALAFIPVALGVGQIYEWADPAHVAHDPLLQHKAAYLNVPFFLARTAVYFVAWILASRALRRWSLIQDTRTDDVATDRLELLSRGGLVLLGLTISFAAVDWMMSLEPHWQSAIYGMLFMIGGVLTAFALMIAVAATAASREPYASLVEADQFHDLGKLLLGFVMVWAYFSFSQFLIIWSANLPEEIPWYIKRSTGGWSLIVFALIICHFALPFVVLLSRTAKRRSQVLRRLGLFLLVMRFFDVFWMLAPAFHPDGFRIHWLDIATVVGLGGLWLTAFIKNLEGVPLLPLHDPSLPLSE